MELSDEGKKENPEPKKKLTFLTLPGIIKTIEGDLQNALYYCSQSIFSKNDHERFYYLRKVESMVNDIKVKIEEINGSPDSSTNTI